MKRMLCFVVLVAACRGHENVSTTTTSTTSSSPTTATTAAPSAVPASAEDLASVAQGAMIVKSPESLEYNLSGFRLIDDDPRYGWTSPEGKATNQVAVIQLPERCAIEKIQFDTAVAELDTHSAKNVKVEISDTSADDGFKPLASVTLAAQKDGQVFPADANVPGRFIRLTAIDNYGAGVTQIGEFRAFGKKLTNTPLANLTGTYKSDQFVELHLMQKGTSVSGCYEGALQPITGGIEDHIVKFTYETSADKGPALLAFSTDGKRFFGGYWKISEVVEHPGLFVFEGTKVSDDPGTCPGKKPEEQMESELADAKRLRLYGINFDSDSDHLRDESKPTLDLVAAILTKHADWKLTIEGHTDSTSTPEHNQQLSVARANAVKTYLGEHGVDAGRLSTAGLGATKPVATNDTVLGRAANRRVELVRE